ncbi:MAG: hypothetical protein WBB69_14345 [Anaerolineales bacterium]
MPPKYLFGLNLERPFLWADLDIIKSNISCLAEYFKQANIMVAEDSLRRNCISLELNTLR